jgi:glycosyltransferase involved in cell wall biosynthesis
MDIILFSDIDWADPRRYPVHHVVGRLAREHRVFFVDNFGGVRDLRLDDLKRGLGKVETALQRRSGEGEPVRETPKNVTVYQPLIIPTPRFPNTIGRFNGYLIARGVQRLIQEYNIRHPVVWTRVETHIAWFAIRRIDPAMLVYQVVDNFPHNPVIPSSLRDRHAEYADRFSRSADLIFASARGLKDKKEPLNEDVHFFPNGVEVDKFRQSFVGEPDAMREIPSPRLGFVGTVAPPVDFPTIERVARRKSEWSFVFIGPVTQFASLRDLKKLDNVYFLGPVDHDDLPAYCQSLDLGLIPYERTEFTEYTFPSKLAEYLASGVPVLSSNIPEMRHYEDLIGIYCDDDSFIQAAEVQMSKTSDADVSKRQDLAHRLSWTSIVRRMTDTIQENLPADLNHSGMS